ncbi:uncharacterized protein LOC136028456 [Artemia franciscana]|uniref:uncharacterized protein LOC136028456 n=1 Tax=Artemia franciscana TaxID=6661 RepID=UPI0032DB4667
MGVKIAPSYQDFWSNYNELRDNYISGMINISCFIWLLVNIHVNDNLILQQKGGNNYDKLYKIKPLNGKLCSSFLRTYKSTKEQAVNKSIVKFKEWIVFKQYIHMKPIKQGYNIWVRA